MKTIGTQVLIAIFLLFVAFQSFNLYIKEHQEVKRLQMDLKITQDSARYFRGRDGEKAVKIQVMDLTIKELRSTFPSAIQAAKNLYIPPRLIKGYTEAAIDNSKELRVVIRDSIIHDTIPARYFIYDEKFYHVKGLILKDTAHLKINSIDTIKYFQSSGRRRHPWAWIFSRRNPDQVIISNVNTDNKIVLIKSINIKK